MTANEARKIIFRKCKHCKYFDCDVWQGPEPIEENGYCLYHSKRKEASEECCRSFDYARWIVERTIKENRND